MVNLVPAKCPNCGAQLELDDNMKRAECNFCKSTIIVDDAIVKYKIEISGEVKVDGIVGQEELLKNAEAKMKIGKYGEAYNDYKNYWNKYPSDEKGYLSYLHLIMYDENIKKDNYDLFLKLLTTETKEKKDFFKIATAKSKEKYLEEFNEFFKNNEKELKEDTLLSDKFISCAEFNVEFNENTKKKYGIDDERIELMKKYFYIYLLDSAEDIEIHKYNPHQRKYDLLHYDKSKHLVYGDGIKKCICAECSLSLTGKNKFKYSLMDSEDYKILFVKDNKVYFSWCENLLDYNYISYYGYVLVPEFDKITYEELKDKLSKYNTYYDGKKNADIFYEKILKKNDSVAKNLGLTGFSSDESMATPPSYIFDDGLVIGTLDRSSESYTSGRKTSYHKICFKLKVKSVIDKIKNIS